MKTIRVQIGCGIDDFDMQIPENATHEEIQKLIRAEANPRIELKIAELEREAAEIDAQLNSRIYREH